MMTNTELEIFKSISEPTSIGDIAKTLRISNATASRYSDKLVDNGLALKYRKGKKVIIKKSETAQVRILSNFIREFPRLRLSDIFSYSTLDLIGMIKNPKTVAQITLVTTISRTGIYNMLRKLTKIGIVLKNNGYYLNPNQRPVQEFADAYFSFMNYRKLSQISPGSIILWQRGREFLFKSKVAVESKNVKITSITKYQSYGLQIIPAEYYYYYSTRKLCISEYIIHTILADPVSIRNNIYACLLYQKKHPKEIIKWASIYDIQDHIQTIIDYLSKQEKNAEFVPPWKEYAAVAEDYGVI